MTCFVISSSSIFRFEIFLHIFLQSQKYQFLQELIQDDDDESEKMKPTNKPKSPDRTRKKFYQGEIHPGEHPYKCTYCDKKFKQVK